MCGQVFYSPPTPMQFRQKIGLIVVAAVVAVVTLSVVAGHQVRKELIEGRRMTLVAAVQSAANIAAAYEQQATAGRLPRDEAQRAAKEAIKAARYGGADGKTDYFYIWSVEGDGVMHPFKPEWDGQPMLGKVKDGAGKDIIGMLVAGVKASANGTAFVPTGYIYREGGTHLTGVAGTGQTLMPEFSVMKVGSLNVVYGASKQIAGFTGSQAGTGYHHYTQFELPAGSV